MDQKIEWATRSVWMARLSDTGGFAVNAGYWAEDQYAMGLAPHPALRSGLYRKFAITIKPL